MSQWQSTTRRTGVALVTATALACSGSTPESLVRPDYREVAERLSAFIEHEMADKELPALSIVLVDDQETVWAEGFGWEDPVDSVPATAETVYRVGSVSKLFTDLGIMQAVERGTLDLDQPVTELLPGFGPESDFETPVTLRQLMSHRAGLVREAPTGNYFDATLPSLEATVASLNSTRAVYEPGARIKYSNIGIATVGYVLEVMSGEPFAEYLKAAVLDPLGMDESSFLPEPDVIDRLATAYMWTYDGRTFEAPTFQLGMAPAGSMYAPVTDLGLFMQALFAHGRGIRGAVVSPSTLETMLQPQFAEAGATTGYGLGFALSEFRGRRAIGHGGAIYGFATDLVALPGAKLGAAAVTTMDGANTVVSRVTRYALDLMLALDEDQPLPEAETTHGIPAGLAEAVVGRYGSGDESLEITARGGGVYVWLANPGLRLRLRAIGDTLVVDDRLSYGMRIRPAPEGVFVNGRLRKRVPTPPPDRAPARWSGLIGEYGWDYNTLYVLEREGRLYALIEWFFLYPLEELSPDVFASPTGVSTTVSAWFSGGMAQGRLPRWRRPA
ncbi:MAG: hypothetical protein BMS9Abin29_1093 [Gemmatimonadota bacterium]|nr:MAG: hypothetical protein BMS9Abin29_1093 [Gemmatimonadota bacterium]